MCEGLLVDPVEFPQDGQAGHAPPRVADLIGAQGRLIGVQ